MKMGTVIMIMIAAFIVASCDLKDFPVSGFDYDEYQTIYLNTGIAGFSKDNNGLYFYNYHTDNTVTLTKFTYEASSLINLGNLQGKSKYSFNNCRIIDLSNGRNYLVASQNLAESKDNEASWSWLNNKDNYDPLVKKFSQTIVEFISSTQDGTLIAGAPYGLLWKSKDGGANWEILDDYSNREVLLKGFYTVNNILFKKYGSKDNDNGIIYRSSDMGSSWTECMGYDPGAILDGDLNIWGRGASFFNNGILYLQNTPASNGSVNISVSEDLGKTFNIHTVYAPLDKKMITNLKFVGEDNALYFYCTHYNFQDDTDFGDDNGIYKTTDFGKTWKYVLATDRYDNLFVNKFGRVIIHKDSSGYDSGTYHFSKKLLDEY